MLKLQEKSIILGEEDLSHQVVILDHFEQINDIQVSVEHLSPLLEVHILLCGLNTLKRFQASAVVAAEEVAKRVASVVCEARLIQNKVEDVVQLLALGFVTNQHRPLLFQILHKVAFRRLFVLIDTFQDSFLTNGESVASL